jgi:hypothetical protein
MKSGVDWTELGLSGPAAFLFTPPIANLIEERTRAIAISIIKIFIKILRRFLPGVICGGGAQRWILASYREFFVVDQQTCYYKAFLAVIDFFATFARDRICVTLSCSVCWRGCKSHPIIRISASFGPSSVG